MSSVKNQQQTLTDFFAAKKSSKVPAKQALEKLRSLHTDLAEIRSKRTTRSTAQQKEKSPAFERYAELLQPALTNVDTTKSIKAVSPKKKISPKLLEETRSGKSALSRLEAKRAVLKAAREKLQQVEKDKATLHEFQQSKPTVERLPEVPAYEKYHYLAVPSDKLPLPLHYQRLLEGFGACDTVVSMFHNRKEICRLDKLSSAVSKMTGRLFGTSHIGKVLTLKPDAYSIKVEKHRFLDCKSKLHHIVTFPDVINLNLEPKFLSKRKTEFKGQLLRRVGQYHQEFLDREMPGSDLPFEAVKRWHPKFKLDSVPDILSKELPKIDTKSEIVNAKEVLEKVRGKFSERIEKALQSLVEKQKVTEEKTQEKDETPTKTLLTGVSQSLLERIKKREALKMAEKMVMASDDANDKRQLVAVSSLIRTIRQIFLTWQKAAIPYAELRTKILDTGSYDDVDTLLNRVAEVAPEWFKLLTVRNTKFVKIDKARDVNTLCARVDSMVKSEGKCL